MSAVGGGTPMKAIRVHAPGGQGALRYEEIERAAPGPGQVLVMIEADGVNFIDVYQRTGLYKVQLPFTFGQEAAGIVTALCPAATARTVPDGDESMREHRAYA